MSQPFRAEILNQRGAAYTGLADYLNAFNRFRLTAELGNVLSQLNLADMNHPLKQSVVLSEFIQSNKTHATLCRSMGGCHSSHGRTNRELSRS